MGIRLSPVSIPAIQELSCIPLPFPCRPFNEYETYSQALQRLSQCRDGSRKKAGDCRLQISQPAVCCGCGRWLLRWAFALLCGVECTRHFRSSVYFFSKTSTRAHVFGEFHMRRAFGVSQNVMWLDTGRTSNQGSYRMGAQEVRARRSGGCRPSGRPSTTAARGLRRRRRNFRPSGAGRHGRCRRS